MAKSKGKRSHAVLVQAKPSLWSAFKRLMAQEELTTNAAAFRELMKSAVRNGKIQF